MQGNLSIERMEKLERDKETITKYILHNVQLGELRIPFLQHLFARYDFEIANGLNIEDLLDSLIAKGKIVELQYVITNERFIQVRSVLFPSSVKFFNSSLDILAQYPVVC